MERCKKGVSPRGLDRGEDALGVEGPRSGIIAPDFAGSNRGNRWHVFSQSTTVIKLNPKESMITVHSQRTVKGEITRSIGY